MKTRSILILTSISLAGLLLAACSSNYNQRPPNRLPPNPHAVKVRMAWSHGVGGGGGDQLLGLAPGSDQNEVVAAAANGHVAAFDAASGKQRWSRRLKARLSAGPAVGNGLVVVTTRTGDVIALDAKTGARKWEHYVGAPVIANPAIDANVVAVKTIAGALIGLSPATGSSTWESDEPTPSLTLRFDTQPLIVDGVVYAGFADGKAIAVNDTTGKESWRKQITQGQGGNPVADMVDVGGVMAYASGDLYVATYQGRLAALDAATGEIAWSRKLSSYTGVTIDAAHLYSSDAEGRVHAYDLVTGVPSWTYGRLAYRSLSAAVPFGSVVAVGDRFGWLHFLDSSNGHYLNRVKVGDGAIRMPPVVVDNLLIVLDNDGTLAAYTLPSAKP